MKNLTLISTILTVLLYINVKAQTGGSMLFYKGGQVTYTINLTDFDSIKFTPCYSNCGKVRDYDGNIYSTVIIGTQCWMQKNLNTTHYSNGTPIHNVKDSTKWWNLTTGAYCNYDNDTVIALTYGRLYNWYAVSDSNHICPAGWHVPADSEWTELVTYLGDTAVAGGKMKEAGYSHWQSPNVGATNSSGFTALPGGYCDVDSYYCDYLGLYASFWSSTKKYAGALSPALLSNGAYICMSCGWDKTAGFSVRCIKN